MLVTFKIVARPHVRCIDCNEIECACVFASRMLALGVYMPW